MLYAVIGSNEFLREEFVGQLKTLMRRLPAGEHNIDELGPNATARDIIAACSPIPFLCDKRMVIVRGASGSANRERSTGSLLGRARSRAPGHFQAQELADYLPHLPESTHLVLVEEEPGPIHAVLAARPDVVRRDFPPLRDDEVPSWISARARRYGAKVSPRTARELGHLVGSDLRALDSEIAKLATYIDPGGTIEPDDVQALTRAAGPGMFTLHDALAERRAGPALGAAQTLLAAGHDPVELLAQVIGVVRRLLITKELVAEGRPLGRDGAAYGLSTSPYMLRRLQQQAAPISAVELEQAYVLLRDADLAIKTGRCAPEVAVERAIAEICGLTPA